MSPVVRRVLRAVPRQEGYVFSPDRGKTPIGDGSWLKPQAGHASAGFTLDRYGHLFETITLTHAEWPEELLWTPGEDPMCTIWAQKSGTPAETGVPTES